MSIFTRKTLASSVSTQPTPYVDDVFSTYLYTGNGSTQTITNGIDLAGEGGLVWLKARNSISSVYMDHNLYDTERGVNKRIKTNSTDAEIQNIGSVTSFNTNGFSLGSYNPVNDPSGIYTSWTFRKAPKFFDVVTYTGDGVAGRQIPHNLGIEPGMIIVKRLDANANWPIWHRSIASFDAQLNLNTTTASGGLDFPLNADMNESTFQVSNAPPLNAAGATYVAYLFAHDPDPDEGIIQCGSFTTDGSGNATVDLGWEPQYVLYKSSNNASDWELLDTMRGMPVGIGGDNSLRPNNSSAEYNIGSQSRSIDPTSIGFTAKQTSSWTYIYLAIRRPNKPPESGSEVYNALLHTGNNSSQTITGTGFPTDTLIVKSRTLGYGKPAFHDRLRGVRPRLFSSTTDAEFSTSPVVSFDQNGYTTSSDADGSWNQSGGYVNYFFKRAPGFFDVVCYTGDGVSGRTVDHNLKAVPEMMIVKTRSGNDNWWVYHQNNGNTGAFVLNTGSGFITNSSLWNNTTPTENDFTLGSLGAVNYSGATFISYLFATLPGISKVGSYIGNGSSQTIDCGFSTGARFILIKNTSGVSDWYVWDTARGIVAANDPHLSLNSTAAEVTTDDSIDPASAGFIVNQNTATNINVNSVSYIFLAIA